MARKRLGEILMEAGLLTEAQLQVALSEQKRWGGQLGKLLVDMQIVQEEHLVQALANQMNFPIINLDTLTISANVLEWVEGESAERHSAIPFRSDDRFLDVAMANPADMGIVDELRIRTKKNIRPYLAGPAMIQRALVKYYNRGKAGFGPRSTENFNPDDFQIVHSRSRNPPSITAGQAPISSEPARTRKPSETEVPSLLEVRALQERVAKLEALVLRDESVLKKMMALLIEKGVASREEILKRIS